MKNNSKLIDSNLNVCLLNDSFRPQIDGVVNVIANYANVIENETNGSACIATPYFPEAVDDYNYDVYRYKSFNLGDKFCGYRVGVPYLTKADDKIINWKPDIIHTHCPFASALMAQNLGWRTDVPVVFTYHTKFDVEIDRSMKSSIMQKIARDVLVKNIRDCDEVWAVSEGAGENLRSLGYQGDYIVMKNGVDFPCSRSDEVKLNYIRNEYGLSEAIPTFIFVGRLIWYKGIKIILDGLEKVKNAGQQFKMIFVGDGSDGKEIREYAKQIGVSDCCIFTGKINDRGALKDLYCIADMLLFPSTYDTNGLVVGEAAACSVGSMLIKGSCAAEGAIDGVNSILIDGSSDMLATKVIDLCKNPLKLREIGEAASKDLFISWSDAVANAVERYKIICENHKRKSTARRLYDLVKL